MYVILVYDVRQERVKRVMRKCRQYLYHVQRSVFEGNLSEGQLERLKRELAPLVDPTYDALCLYCMGSSKYATKHQLGVYTPLGCLLGES